MAGSVQPLMKGIASAMGHTPSRPMGGWLMTYGKLGPQGGVIPTVDRDGHVMEAARELGHIDWTPYLEQGLWNDTHNEEVIVGVPTSLEFHDGTTELSKSHGKLGFWTAGHLFDRNDPRSWELYTDRKPSEDELARSDHFWMLANMLKGLPRPLGFSAHGHMALSPCKKRVVWCRVKQSAICELPKNPDTTAEMLKGSPLEIMRKGMDLASGRGCTCDCCALPLSKASPQFEPALNTGGDGQPTRAELTRPDVDDLAIDQNFKPTGNHGLDDLLRAIMRRFFVDQGTASRWISKHFQGTASGYAA